MELYGIAEPPGLYFDGHFDGTCSSFPILSEGEDIVEHIFDRQQELGVRNVIWQLGRTWLTFHTDHPDLTVQGSITRQENLVDKLSSRLWYDYLQEHCPLRRALDEGEARGMPVWGWLCMNRNYRPDDAKFSISRFWADNHPLMGEYTKTGERDFSRLCYIFPEYREERLAAVLEAAKASGYKSEKHLETIVIDFVRQPPMLQYHPLLCEKYEQETGTDPRQIPAQDVEAYPAWCKWRADILTDFVRTVRAELNRYGDEIGHAFKLVPRITDLGVNVNLIEGIDIVTWCQEGLIDGIVTSPLNWVRTVWEHDLRPYALLGQTHGIPIIAGVSLNQQTRFHRNGGSVNFAVLARRVHDYQTQGADGIAFYQSESGLEFDGIEEVVPRLADPEETRVLLSDRAFLDRWPVTHLNCAYGLDCHSWFNNFTIDNEHSPI